MKKQFIYSVIGVIALSIFIAFITSCTKENEIPIESPSKVLSQKEIEQKLFDVLPKYFEAKHRLYTTGVGDDILEFYDDTATDNAQKIIDDIKLNHYVKKSIHGYIKIGDYSFSEIEILSFNKQDDIYTTKIQAFESEIFYPEVEQERFETSSIPIYTIRFVVDDTGEIKLIDDIDLDEIYRKWGVPFDIEKGESVDSYIEKRKNILKKTSKKEAFIFEDKKEYRGAIGAVLYARLNYKYPESSVCDYSEGGGDCTNFVSNALHKGGKISQRSKKWYHKYSFCWNSRLFYSLSWTVADDFYKYMKESSIMYPQSISIENLRLGDVISFSKAGKIKAVHTAIVTKVDKSSVYVTYRNGGGYSPVKNSELEKVRLKILQTFRPRY